MQPIAAWLVARPHNAVLALAASFLLPLAPILSGSLMVLLALELGPSRAAVYAAISGAVLAAMALVTQAHAPTLLANVAGIWLPALLLAAMLRQWRSVTLVMQVSAIIAVAVILAMHAVIADTDAYGAALIAELASELSRAGLQQQADLLDAARFELAPQVLLLVVYVGWQLNVVTLLLGYAILQTLPERNAVFGRFRDLDFGRVLAILMAVSSIGGWASGAPWLMNAAFLLFMAFWMQGLAILHWFKAEKRLPAVALVVVYASLPFLHVLALLVLAVGGYADVWVGFRRRATA